MHRPLLLRGARQLLTLRGPEGPRRGAGCLDLGVINDGSVLIRDGKIVSVGQARRVDNLSEARNAIVHEVNGAVVMPSFVDADFCVPPAAALARKVLQLAFEHGSGAIGVCAPYLSLRSLAAADPVSAGIVPSLEIEAEFDEAQLQRAVRRNLAAFLRLDMLAHGRTALHLIRSLGPQLRIYCADGEQPDWVGYALAYGASVLDIRSPLNKAQTALVADSDAVAVLTPSGATLARQLLEAGSAMALGSGFQMGGGGTCSMQTAALQLVREGGLDIAEAITLSTINAAHALGVGGSFGSIEAGKQANLLVLHLSDFRDIVNFTGVNVVSKIIQAGTLVL